MNSSKEFKSKSFKDFGALAIVVFLSACNAPTGPFRGLPAVTVGVGGSTFDIRRSGREVQVIRTNSEMTFTLAAIAPRALSAIRMATGCAVQDGTLRGDAILMTARLTCPER